MAHAQQILFVDDDEITRRAFQRTMVSAGFEVHLASGGDEARRLVRDHEYAVVATDYYMPDITGLELVDELHRVQPDATFMLMSSETDLAMALRAVNDHPVSYVLPKPWDIIELTSLINRSLEDYWERASSRQLITRTMNVGRRFERQRARLRAASPSAAGEPLAADELANAIEPRGHETRAHCRRMAAFARLIAEALGVEGEALEAITLAAVLHDVGMFVVPDEVLFKDGPLADDEWEMIRAHPEKAKQLLAGIPALSAAREIVVQHHERWNGTGYPASLRAEQISLGARILAVADCLDAIMNDRRHRAALGYDTARSEIARLMGVAYDPVVVRAFTAIPKQEWVEIRSRYPD